MATKHDLMYSIINTLNQIKDRSYNTRAARKKRLLMTAEQLVGGGYKILGSKRLCVDR